MFQFLSRHYKTNKKMEIQKFKEFLEKNQLGDGAKTFNLKGIEEKLNIPAKTIDHFLQGRRGLGAYQEKVINYFRNLGFQQHMSIGRFSINNTDRVTIQDTQSGELAEFSNDAFEKVIEKFFKDNF